MSTSLLFINWVSEVTLTSVLVPIVAASIGAGTVASVSRHLRRQELYVEAAQKINEYIDEASDALNEIDDGDQFDPEPVSRAYRAVSLARFHSKRLESDDVTGRLTVTRFVLSDIVEERTYRGRFWAYQAIDDVMSAVVEFMILPRLWPPRRGLRKLPPHRLPNESMQYLKITQPDPDTDEVNWKALRHWVRQREKDLTSRTQRPPRFRPKATTAQ